MVPSCRSGSPGVKHLLLTSPIKPKFQNTGVIHAACPATTHVSECAVVVHDRLQDHVVKASAAVLREDSMGRAGEGDVGPIQGPDPLG